jgi:hypothetical protein
MNRQAGLQLEEEQNDQSERRDEHESDNHR